MEMLDSERGRDQLGKALQELQTLINKAELEEKEALALEKLARGVDTASLNYLEAVIDHYSASDAKGAMSANIDAWKQLLMDKDRRRTFAHNALLDSVRILVRNAVRFEVDGAEKYSVYMVETEGDDTRRRWLGKLALIHAFNAVIETVLEDL